ncbi:CHRD domain-containing protein [Natronococcus wangiae]
MSFQTSITEDGLVGPFEGSTLEELLEQLRGEAAYVNVHTEQQSGGEIRGQIAPADTVTVEFTEQVDATVAADEALRVEPQVTLDVIDGETPDGEPDSDAEPDEEPDSGEDEESEPDDLDEDEADPGDY